MTDLKTTQAHFSSHEYVQRVTIFLQEVSDWCRGRELTVEYGAVTLREEFVAPYEAASLHISKDGVPLGRIVPVGSRIIGAEGRVDLIGQLARHPIVYHVWKDSALSTRAISNEKAITSPSTPNRSRLKRDGWHWTEAKVRPAKFIDESLFLDLLTDVSDYEFY
ncbi:hypothetical protein GCM10027093_45730 [Paraburkholderia jirisanensis]